MAPVRAVTVLEYLALGKPIVGTRLPGMASLVDEGLNGFLVTPGDAEAMADAIARLVGDVSLAKRFGEASRDAPRSSTSVGSATVARSIGQWL